MKIDAEYKDRVLNIVGDIIFIRNICEEQDNLKQEEIKGEENVDLSLISDT